MALETIISAPSGAHDYPLTRTLREQAGEASFPGSIPPAENRSGVSAPSEVKMVLTLLCWVNRCNMKMNCLV